METTITVSGMSCEHCRASVAEAIRAVAGVKTVSVDLAGGTATWSGDAAPEKVKEAVRAIGFGAD